MSSYIRDVNADMHGIHAYGPFKNTAAEVEESKETENKPEQYNGSRVEDDLSNNIEDLTEDYSD